MTSLRTQTVDFSEQWTPLEEDIIILISNPLTQKPKKDWISLHRLVYSLCTNNCINLPKYQHFQIEAREKQGQPVLLYHLIKETVNTFLKSSLQVRVPTPLFEKFSMYSGEDSLYHYADLWIRFHLGVQILDKICHYLNVNYIQNTTLTELKKPNGETLVCIKYMCFKQWMQVFYNNVGHGLMRACLDEIGRDRGNIRDIKSQAIRALLSSLVICTGNEDLYVSQFETTFLKETRDYYVKETTMD
jgi:hypothetical protein